MLLTKQNTETYTRRLAAASATELTDIAQDCRATAADSAQAPDVRFVARRLANVIRDLVRTRK